MLAARHDQSLSRGDPVARSLLGDPAGRSGENLRLLAFELVVGDRAAVAQVGQFGELVGGAGRCAGRGLLHVLPEGGVLGLLLLHGPFVHLAAAGDQVDQHAEQREDDHE